MSKLSVLPPAFTPAAALRVVPVSPNAIKTWRDGEVLSGADDAAVIADYLRLRQHRLQVARPYSSETKALRTVVRTRDDLVEMRVAATKQLSALLDAHWPGVKVIFADVESPICLAFLTRYPTPASAERLGEKRMATFCVKHGYSGGRSAAELLRRLRAAPAGNTDCQAGASTACWRLTRLIFWRRLRGAALESSAVTPRRCLTAGPVSRTAQRRLVSTLPAVPQMFRRPPMVFDESAAGW